MSTPSLLTSPFPFTRTLARLNKHGWYLVGYESDREDAPAVFRRLEGYYKLLVDRQSGSIVVPRR